MPQKMALKKPKYPTAEADQIMRDEVVSSQSIESIRIRATKIKKTKTEENNLTTVLQYSIVQYNMKALSILRVAAFFPSFSNAFSPKPLRLTKHQHAPLAKQIYGFVPLRYSGDEDEMVEFDDLNGSAQKSNFDGEGFAGYLAPYALAMVASIAVTAAFVKFILLDY